MDDEDALRRGFDRELDEGTLPAVDPTSKYVLFNKINTNSCSSYSKECCTKSIADFFKNWFFKTSFFANGKHSLNTAPPLFN